MDIQQIMNLARGKLAPTALLIRKYAPQLLLGTGVLTGVAAALTSASQTRKLDSVMVAADSIIEQMKLERATFDNDGEWYKAMAGAYALKAKVLLDLYGPAIALGLISVTSLLASHGILMSRNVGLAAAYKIVDESFKGYRRRVVEDSGEKTDYAYLHGLTLDKRTETVVDPETGAKTKKVKEEFRSYVNTAYPLASMYSRVFSQETSSDWQPDRNYNLHFLKCQQNILNDWLRLRGHVFLNEAYDALGLDRTKEGAIVGWVYKEEPDATPRDNYVDFGIFDTITDEVRYFEMGPDNSIIVDFNVGGVILDLI